MQHAAHASTLERHERRLDAHGNEINDLNECIIRLTVLQEEMANWQAKADTRIANLESVPSSRWNQVINTILTAVFSTAFSSIVTYTLLHGGM